MALGKCEVVGYSRASPKSDRITGINVCCDSQAATESLVGQLVSKLPLKSKIQPMKDRKCVLVSSRRDLRGSRDDKLHKALSGAGVQFPAMVRADEPNEEFTGYSDEPQNVTTLVISNARPLSTQLQELTGDGWSSVNFESLEGGNPSAATGQPFRHKKTGRVFTAIAERERDAASGRMLDPEPQKSTKPSSTEPAKYGPDYGYGADERVLAHLKRMKEWGEYIEEQKRV